MARVPVKLVSWDEVVDWCWELSKKIKESGFTPDVVVAIARGGYVPARLVCDFLGVENLLSIQSQHWTEAAKAAEKAIIKFPYKIGMKGKKVLIVDDIADTGDSVILAKEFVEKEWGASEVKIATMQWISKVCKIKPDFYAVEVTEWVWFQYPWTRLEDVEQFIKRMLSEEAKSGKREWCFEEVVEKFKEWYGIDVDRRYYEEALKRLVEKGFLEEKDGKYIVKQG